jgi:hypothetical protein
MRQSRYYWTKENCKKEALRYNTRKSFSVGSPRAYEILRKNDLLDEVCSHMKREKLPHNYWCDIENCKKEALKYKTRTEFSNNSKYVYTLSMRNNWLDDICKHMKPVGDRYNKCIYSYEFPDNHVYVGLTYNIDLREKCRNNDINDAVTKYILNTRLQPTRKQLTDYVNVDDAILLEGKFLLKYINDGWIALNRKKTGGIGCRKRIFILK